MFDPAGRDAWYWDATTGDLRGIKEAYAFRSGPVELLRQEVFRRLDEEVQ